MSYSAIDQLTNSAEFAGRVRACAVEQAETFKDSALPNYVALAEACLVGNGEIYNTFTRLTAAAPGLADQAGDPVDQTGVSDGAILSTVQANWQVVSGLFYNENGEPL